MYFFSLSLTITNYFTCKYKIKLPLFFSDLSPYELLFIFINCEIFVYFLRFINYEIFIKLLSFYFLMIYLFFNILHINLLMFRGECLWNCGLVIYKKIIL